ncbi:MAG: twin-arginine translocase TatA/TatE family subunit [Nitrospirae bacterium]|nr:MAG: twin-arginine translocase TatA/TatE family subunit [Nitrospirota bacterium]
MIGSFGWMELLLILIIVLIIFGAGKIPQLGEGLGKAIKGFKKSVAEADALDVTPNAEQPMTAQTTAPPPQEGAPQPEQVQAQPTVEATVPPSPQPEPAQQPEHVKQG